MEIVPVNAESPYGASMHAYNSLVLLKLKGLFEKFQKSRTVPKKPQGGPFSVSLTSASIKSFHLVWDSNPLTASQFCH